MGSSFARPRPRGGGGAPGNAAQAKEAEQPGQTAWDQPQDRGQDRGQAEEARLCQRCPAEGGALNGSDNGRSGRCYRLRSAFTASAPDPKVFTPGRGFAAWLGSAPRQNSSGGATLRRLAAHRGHSRRFAQAAPGAIGGSRFAQARETGYRRSGHQARPDHLGRPEPGRGVSRRGFRNSVRERRRWRNVPKAFRLARAKQT
ncbi:MAG: transposase [Methylocella sp.]